MCKFENQCDHKPESFYGTVIIDHKEGDLYFYKSDGKWEYCFRTGPDGQYRSFPIDTLYRISRKHYEDSYESQIIEYFIAYMNRGFLIDTRYRIYKEDYEDTYESQVAEYFIALMDRGATND